MSSIVLKNLLHYRLARLNLIKAPMPIILTFSVTYRCQSRCKTCFVWRLYKERPELAEKELTLDEIESIFRSIGRIYFLNISGGEPFLRNDIAEIIGLGCRHLKPRVIHIPTNAINPGLVVRKTREILEVMKKSGCNVPFTIKPSLDGVAEKHDNIRGVKGNFEAVVETIKGLKTLQASYPNLYIGLGSVVSRYNLESIKETVRYAHSLGVETYINEIAEQRSELLTLNEDITPSAEDYQKVIRFFSEEVRKNMKNKKMLSRIMQSFRLVYYDLVVRVIRENRQVIPCYAGLTNAHISADGSVWPCCILGYRKPMGNLRDYGYDFGRLWHSKQADDVRCFIRNKNCACPLANQAYANLLLNTRYMLKVLRNMLL